MSRKFKAKPFYITAIQFTGDNTDEVIEFCANEVLGSDFWSGTRGNLVFDILQDEYIPVNKNDWIIKGMKGEFYPCDPEVFAAKYAEVKDD